MVSVLLLAAACSNDSDSGAGGGEDADNGATTTAAAAPLPEECTIDPPFEIPITGGELLPGVDGPTFEVQDAAALAIPITPDPDGELTFETGRAAAAETDLLGYTVYVADFSLDDAGVEGGFGLTAPVDGTYIGFTLIPPTLDPIATGDVLDVDVPEYESVTTFGVVGVTYATEVAEEFPSLSFDPSNPGRAEVLHVDDEWVCFTFTKEGDLFGGDAEGEWAIDTVLSAPIVARMDLGFS
jgi:hypothetical protein